MEKKTIWITGGTRGLGRELVMDFSKRNYSVVTNYSADDAAAQRLADWAQENHVCVDIRKADVCDCDAMAALAEYIRQKYGPLDLLICTAGQGTVSLLENTSPETFRNLIDVNLFGKYSCIYHALGLLKESKSAAVILIGSTAGEKASVGMGAYCCSQAGVIMLTKILAKELAQYGIRTNCICPSMMEQGMAVRCFSADDRNAVARQNPSGRLCRPEDVLACVQWLCSEAVAYINGEIIHLTGGNL